MHNSDWGSVSTISASMDGAPFGMAISFSDGTVANSTGVPYFYLTKDDPVAKNIESNQLSSLALSEAQSRYCKAHNWDPEEPLCSRVTLIGKVFPELKYMYTRGLGWLIMVPRNLLVLKLLIQYKLSRRHW